MTLTARGTPLTRAELDALPDDGRRHELIDGVLIVTPAPAVRHQFCVGGVYRALHAACASDLVVMVAPVDVVLAEDTVVQPDVLVARLTDLTDRDLPASPLLAVEVLSPSTRLVDLNLKKARYEAAGCPSYWVVDPDVPSITAWELVEGAYVEVARATGEDQFRVEAPYPLAVTPASLLSP